MLDAPIFWHIFCSMLPIGRSSTLEKWGVEKILDSEMFMVDQQHCGWWFTEADCSKIIELKVTARQCSSLQCRVYMTFCHCFSIATALAANWLWSQLIRIHSRTGSFRNFCLPQWHRLKWLCFSIGIWADIHFLDRSSIWTCCSEQDALENADLFRCLKFSSSFWLAVRPCPHKLYKV